MKNPVLELAYNRWNSSSCQDGFDTCLFDATDKQYEAVPGVGSLRCRWCSEVFIHVHDLIPLHKKAFDSVNITGTQRVKGFDAVKPIILEAIEKTEARTEVYDVALFNKYISRMAERFPEASLNLRSYDVGGPDEKSSEMGGFARITGTIIGKCGTVSYTNGIKIFVPSDYDRMVYFSKFFLGSRTHTTFQELFEYWEKSNDLYQRYVVDKQKEVDDFLGF
jgi:hypothetical protein